MVCLEKVATAVRHRKLSYKPLGTRTSVGRPIVRLETVEAKILHTG